MKKIAIAFAVCVLATAAFVISRAWGLKDTNVLQIGNFLVLALTLIVLVWYASDTNAIARVTQERWMREGVLSTTYSMECRGNKGDAGRTYLRLHNPSTLVVRARVTCNLRIYGEPVTAGTLYDGKDVWLLSRNWWECWLWSSLLAPTRTGVIECGAAGSSVGGSRSSFLNCMDSSWKKTRRQAAERDATPDNDPRLR